MSDRLIGGTSSSHLSLCYDDHQLDTTSNDGTAAGTAVTTDTGTAYARFHGHIRTSLPSDRPDILRSGYAAFRTPDQAPTVFGRSVWDIDAYTYLALRIKSDGRAYFVNVQAETVEPSDLHQHRLFAKHPGTWETVLIKWNDFVRTNHGFVVEPQAEMLRQRVRTVGIGLTDRVQGPFEICVRRIWATNDVDGSETIVQGQGGLKNRSGERIPWS